MATLNLTVVLRRADAASLKRDLQVPAALYTGNKIVNRLINKLVSQSAGCDPGSTTVAIQENATAATATLTTTSAIATNTFTINGVTFTGVASGATGNQFNIGTDAATATSMALAISTSGTPLVSGVVVATAVGNVVTVTSVHKGITANSVTIASGQGTIVASAARLSGGLPDPNTITYSL